MRFQTAYRPTIDPGEPGALSLTRQVRPHSMAGPEKVALPPSWREIFHPIEINEQRPDRPLNAFASRLLSGSRTGFVGWGVCPYLGTYRSQAVLTTPGKRQLKVADTPINIGVSRPATILHELTLLKVSKTPARRCPAFTKSQSFDEKEVPSQMRFTSPWRER
jgi:hypothetical protein